MATPLLPPGPLRLDPRFERRQALYVALASLALVPGLAFLWADFGGDMIVWGGLILVLGMLPAGGVYWRWRQWRRICRDPEEVHCRILSRTEQVTNGVPSRRITYTVGLPSSGRKERPQVTVVFGLDEGAPLHVDARGETLVLLRTGRGRSTRGFVAPRADLYPLLLDDEARDRVRHEQVQRRLSFSFGRGFKNVDVIARCLRMLLAAEAAGKLPPRPAEQWSVTQQYDPDDALMSVQRLAGSVTRAFGFDAGTVVVRFAENLAAAGEVEYEAGRGFFVAVRKEFADRPRELVTILAHEVAHILLVQRRLVPDNRFDNEIATDVAAVLWGFGAVMIESHESRFVYSNAFSQVARREITDLGYLTPDECAYVLAKMGDTRPLQRRAEGHARRAYRVGRARARRDGGTPPLRGAPPGRRIWYLIRRRYPDAGEGPSRSETGGYELSGEHVTFRCPRCTQNLRLPVRKKGIATCSGCRLKLPFAS